MNALSKTTPAGASNPPTGGNTLLTLTAAHELILLGIILVGVLAIGGIVIGGRLVMLNNSKGGADTSLVRSWIALALVFGLLIFAAFSLEIDDPTLRSTIFGGLIASVSASVAFYFSSQGTAAAVQAAVRVVQAPSSPTAFSAATPGPATEGVPYSYQFVANGSQPLAYSLIQGTLPTGLTLTDSGTLSGTPTAPGASSVTIRAINTVGHVDSPQLNLKVNPAPTESSVETERPAVPEEAGDQDQGNTQNQE